MSDQRRYGHNHWDLLFGVTLWLLWKWRNNLVFNQDAYPTYAKSIIKKMVCEIITSRETSVKGDSPMKSETLVGWKRPKEGYFKLNTDGSYRRVSGQASAGAILRDESGH